MFSRQHEVPKLPVPPLPQTMESYLAALRPLLVEGQPGGADAFARYAATVRTWARGSEAAALHAHVVATAQRPEVANWLERWWSDGYLMDRSCPGCFVSPTLTFDNSPCPDPRAMDQCLRAAALTRYTLEFNETVRARTRPVDTARGRPWCMADYKTFLAGTREPHHGRDRMAFYPESRHIVVLCEGRVFRADAVAANGEPASVAALYATLSEIRGRCRSGVGAGASAAAALGVGALTALDRDAWAGARAQLLTSAPNRRALAAVEEALFVVTLDAGAPPEREGATMRCLTFGTTDDGTGGTAADNKASTPARSGAAVLPFVNRWWDKSFHVHVASNGVAALTFEHSAMDSLPPLSWMRDAARRERDDGATHVRLVERSNVAASNAGQTATPQAPLPCEELVFRLDAAQSALVLRGADAARATLAALDAAALDMRAFGRSVARQLAVPSPDAFVQLCMQVAFKTVFGRLPSTYESASTKAFLHGRTETLRSVTDESAAFVRAFAALSKTNKNTDTTTTTPSPAVATAAAALRRAATTHAALGRRCADGQGWDRHLYGLLWAAQDLGLPAVPVVFADPAFALYRTIELSTTHPNAAPGCGLVSFGPVSPKCIGVGYFVFPDRTVLGITSWEAGAATAFRDELRRVMERACEILATTAQPLSSKPRASKL